MRHPNFCYVDLALGGPERRNNVVTVTEAREWLRRANGSEAHVTVCRFPDPFLDHFRETASVRGYDGPAYADSVLFEFDGNDLAESRLAALAVDDVLTTSRTPREALEASYSGGRSIHLRVASWAFGFEPGAELPSVLRALAKRITARAGVVSDGQVYAKTALLRANNTRHPSGRYKILLSFEELRSLSVDEILALAVAPRLGFPRANGNGPVVPELAEFYRECIEEVRARARDLARTAHRMTPSSRSSRAGTSETSGTGSSSPSPASPPRTIFRRSNAVGSSRNSSKQPGTSSPKIASVPSKTLTGRSPTGFPRGAIASSQRSLETSPRDRSQN